MTGARRAIASVVVGLLAGGCAWALRTAPLLLHPADGAWPRFVRGAHGDGRLGDATVLDLPGLDRRRASGVVLEAEGGPANVSVVAEGPAPMWFRVAGPTTIVVPVTPSRVPGLQLSLRAEPAPGAIRLAAIRVPAAPRAGAAVLVVALVAAVIAALLPWSTAPALSAAVALVAAGLLALASTPVLLAWSLPAPSALARLAPVAATLAAGAIAGLRDGSRRRFARAAALLAAAVFGAWVRLYFLPSAGSWDVDYWKACAVRTAAHGVTRAYGDPDAVPPGHFLAQMSGREPQWELPAPGRTFVIDQPPGIMLLWQSSWRVLSRMDVGLTADEALNVAAKAPAVLGDVAAVGVLLWAFGRARGAALAAWYWALPVSWLSSAVLGFFDGTYVPVAVAALVYAARGRPTRAGGTLAVAALVKSLALLFAPAAAVALRGARASLRPAIAAGLVVAALALLPFALDGTLATLAVHLFRILFQQRLSGGYANAWWLVGHFATLDVRAATDAVPYVRIAALPAGVTHLGTLLFAAAVAWIVRCHLGAAGPRAAALAAAATVLAYGQLAIGVHENHPHAFVLALLATGLATRRLRWIAALFFTTYVLNMLALSGLGRYYGLRHLEAQGVVSAVAALRLAAGFDLTLLLAVVNLAAFATLLAVLPAEMRRLSAPTESEDEEPAS